MPEHSHHSHDTSHHEHVSMLARLKEKLMPHSHAAEGTIDTELEASQKGMRALLVSFAALGITALLQLAVVLASGSVALLGDTLHNAADASTALPLAIAFTIGRRLPTKKFTYGYGRAEDLAGLAVIVVIAASAFLALASALYRLFHQSPVNNVPLVCVAALIGALGNETVARYRLRVGRSIGSAALQADGIHARTDALTSLTVLLGALGVAVGFPIADPIVGLVITLVILATLRQTAREIFHRMLDAVSPALVDEVHEVTAATKGVIRVGDVKLRWIGHSLRAECEIEVESTLSVEKAHEICEEVQHRLLHEIHRLSHAFVHADPAGSKDHHSLTRHHR